MNEPTCLTKPIRTSPLQTLEHAVTELIESIAGRIARTNPRPLRVGRGSIEESTAGDAQRTGKQHRSPRARRVLEQYRGGNSGMAISGRGRSDRCEGMQEESMGVETGRCQ